jgi:hypothetical protein
MNLQNARSNDKNKHELIFFLSSYNWKDSLYRAVRIESSNTIKNNLSLYSFQGIIHEHCNLWLPNFSEP